MTWTAFGPGKYDQQCTEAREAVGAAGAVLLIVEGSNGSGFSFQADTETLLKLPAILEIIAAGIRNELALASMTPNAISGSIQ